MFQYDALLIVTHFSLISLITMVWGRGGVLSFGNTFLDFLGGESKKSYFAIPNVHEKL